MEKSMMTAPRRIRRPCRGDQDRRAFAGHQHPAHQDIGKAPIRFRLYSLAIIVVTLPPKMASTPRSF